MFDIQVPLPAQEVITPHHPYKHHRLAKEVIRKMARLLEDTPQQVKQAVIDGDQTATLIFWLEFYKNPIHRAYNQLVYCHHCDRFALNLTNNTSMTGIGVSFAKLPLLYDKIAALQTKNFHTILTTLEYFVCVHAVIKVDKLRLSEFML